MAIPLRPLAGGIARALAFILLIFLLQAAIVSVFGQPLQWLDDATHDKQISNGMILLVSALAATAIMLRSIDVARSAETRLTNPSVTRLSPIAASSGWPNSWSSATFSRTNSRMNASARAIPPASGRREIAMVRSLSSVRRGGGRSPRRR